MRIASLDEGVLVLPVQDLVEQSRQVNDDLLEAERVGGVHTVRLTLLGNDHGWSDLPELFRQIFRLLPVRALQIEDAVVVLFTFADPRGDYVARALGQVPRPERLEELALRRSRLTSEGFERLEPFCAGLARLDVTDNFLDDDALQRLASWSETTRSLESLHFGSNQPTARGVDALASGRDFPALARLDLSNGNLGGASVRRIVDGTLGALTELLLAENPLGDDGASAIAGSPTSTRFERLSLSRCAIGEDGAMELATSPHLHEIGVLDLRGNKLGDRSRKRLHDRFGERVLVG